MTTSTIDTPLSTKLNDKSRKSKGLNKNKNGSVRKINNTVYVDFYYMGERVRESSNLEWNEKNAKLVRGQLDKIIVDINTKNFRFKDVFPYSKKVDYFTKKELNVLGGNKTAEQVIFKEYVNQWYELLKKTEKVTQRTLLGYKSYIENYLIPFFGELKLSDINKGTFDKFVAWAKNVEYKGKPLSNKTVNKIFVPLKMICRDASIEYQWSNNYNPFFCFKKLPENDAYEKINPFSIDEQRRIIEALPEHWKPFFDTAFKIGLRFGEQTAIKPEDIDWDKRILRIKAAFTRDENGKRMIGTTKNKYSRRTIKLTPIMFEALKAQESIYNKFKCEYFFCSSTGVTIDSSRLRTRVWIPALKKAVVEYREMKQTRHSFATNALSVGENPLWIAKIMGHKNSEMINKVYTKYIEDSTGVRDGNNFDALYN